MREVLTFFVLLTSMYICTEGCGCLRQHPQVQFCNAAFVVKAKILNRTSTVPVDPERLRSGHTLFFTVKIIQDYKNQKNRYTYQTQDIYTQSHDSFCGENFLIGDEYIIMGRIHEGQWRTIHCDGNSIPSFLSSYQKEAYLLEYYKKGCLCQVDECYNGHCPPKTANNCVIPQENTNCFYRQNSCQRRGNNCSWHSPACL